MLFVSDRNWPLKISISTLCTQSWCDSRKVAATFWLYVLNLLAFKTSLGPLIYFVYWSENFALSNVVWVKLVAFTRYIWVHLFFTSASRGFREAGVRSSSLLKNCTKFQFQIPNGSMSKMFPISSKGRVSFVGSKCNSQVWSSPEIKLFWFLCFELNTHLYQYLNPLLGP